MKIISVNISKPKTLRINGVDKKTGIFKKQVPEIYLGTSDVVGDSVMNRKHHGGPEKACFIFSTDHYDYWKQKYPDLEWEWGMFGENLSVEGWDESKIRIGDTFIVGDAKVQVSSPRIPCNYLAQKFKDKFMIGSYLNYVSPGTYLRVLQEGVVRANDVFECIETQKSNMTVLEVYELLVPKKKSKEGFEKAMKTPLLSPEFKKSLSKKH